MIEVKQALYYIIQYVYLKPAY